MTTSKLVAEADRLGYYTNLITSGVGLTEQRLLAPEGGRPQADPARCSPATASTDRLVGAKAFDLKIRVARLIKAHGFPMVLNVPVFRHNGSRPPRSSPRPRTSA